MNNRLITYTIMVAIIIAVTVFLRTFVYATLYSETADAAIDYSYDGDIPDVPLLDIGMADIQLLEATTTVPSVISHAIPVVFVQKFTIPALGINTTIQHVGLNFKGDMATPSNFKEVAWYAKGTKPGNKGSAVIAGHYDNGLGMAGVFRYLENIQKDDLIYIDKTADLKLKFKVIDIKEYEYQDPELSGIFIDNNGRSLVRLVTCTGDWLPTQKTYSRRLIVTAELMP